jgi:hypothetical protein
VHDPVHWLFALTHLPLAQFESATQRHAVWVALGTGAGDRGVMHEYAEAGSPVWIVWYPYPPPPPPPQSV